MEGTTPPPIPPGTQPSAPPQSTPTPTPAPAQPSRSLNDERHDIDTRPCRACNGQLVFDIDAQKLRCPHCGSIEEIVNGAGAVVEERSYAVGLSSAQQFAGTRMQSADDEKEIVCQYCGGHTTFTGTLTATKCPYCATPIQRTDVHDAPDRLAVDGVLPFQVSEKSAREVLEKWISKRWFAPNEFKQYSTAGSFESVYSAYYTFDADASTDYAGERGEHRTRTVREGNETRTVTETEWYSAQGRVLNSFDDITILANTGFDARFVNKLEPWPTQGVQPFSPDYMAGHLAKTYDRQLDDCFAEARQGMESTIDRSIRSDIGGNEQRIHRKSTTISNLTYKHVLLPIWLLTVLYEGKPLQVFINGATGEIHGERPWSKPKIIATVVAVIIVIVALLVLRAALKG